MTKTKFHPGFGENARFTLMVIGTLAFISRAPEAPTLPNINTNNVVNITTYGAVGDGTADNTTAIQNAINAAAALSGGGTVEVPAPGVFLSGPLTLKSKVNLQVDSGATPSRCCPCRNSRIIPTARVISFTPTT